MTPRGNRERMCKYVYIYMYVFLTPKVIGLSMYGSIYRVVLRLVHKPVRGVVRGVLQGVVVSVFNSSINMHVQKMKFQNNCSLKYRLVFCIGRARDALRGISFLLLIIYAYICTSKR